MNEHVPYYYGLSGDYPGGSAVPYRPVGDLYGTAMRQGSIGVDNGLWYQKMVGAPLNAFQIPITNIRMEVDEIERMLLE